MSSVKPHAHKEEEWQNSDLLLFENDDTKKQSSQHDEYTNSVCLPAGVPHDRQDSLTSVSEIPPWITSDTESNCRFFVEPPIVRLHNEIVEFATLMSPQPEEITERGKFIVILRELIEETFGKEKCKVKVFGSQATGLWLPTSDVDIVLEIPDFVPEDDEKSTKGSSSQQATKNDSSKDQDSESKKAEKTVPPTTEKKEDLKRKEQEEMENYNIDDVTDNLNPLARLAMVLQTKWAEHLSYLELIENTRIPIIKFTHAPTNLSCDICLNQVNGPAAAKLVQRFLDAMPPLKPLTFVLKYFLASRRLNEPYLGGVGSFMLQMMIVSFLQHRERDNFNMQQRDEYGVPLNRGYEDNEMMRRKNLGSLLLEFFQLYGGGQLNYVTTGISVRNDGFYFAKGSKDRKENFWHPARSFSLAMENPLEIDSDVGKPSFRMQNIAKSFEISYHVLMSHVSDPAVPTKSILASILPPTEQMKMRATLMKVNRIERRMQDHGYSLTDYKDNNGKPINSNNPIDEELSTERGPRKKQRKM